jgi:hypothetical protein
MVSIPQREEVGCNPEKSPPSTAPKWSFNPSTGRGRLQPTPFWSQWECGLQAPVGGPPVGFNLWLTRLALQTLQSGLFARRVKADWDWVRAVTGGLFAQENRALNHL